MNKWYQIIVGIIALVGISMWYLWRKAEKPILPTKTIIVGTNAEFQPFTFKKNGKIVGFDIDVIAEVSKRIDKEMVLKDMPFDALIPEIQLGNIHVIAASMTPTKERAKRVLFTKPYFDSDPLVIITSVKNQETIKKVQDLVGKRVAVNEGYTADMYMSKIEGIDLKRLYSTMISEGLLALQSNRADAFVASRSSTQPYFEQYGTQEFNVVPIEGTEETDALAISKHYPELHTEIQEALDAMQEDGTLQQLKKKWGLI